MFKEKLKNLETKILEAGVSPKYVKRTIRELQDHYMDVKRRLLEEGVPKNEAGIQAESQLGDLQGIADHVIGKKELRSLISLHPKLFFLLSPMVCYMLFALLIAAVLYISVQWFHINDLPTGSPVPIFFISTVKVLTLLYVYILPVLMSITAVVMARQRLISTAVLVASLVVISALGAIFNLHIEGSFIGSGNVTASMTFVGLDKLLRFVTTMAIGIGFYWILGRKEKLQAT